MQTPSGSEPTAEQRKLLWVVFQVVGLTDILLGAGFVIFGPSIFGIEPLILWICGVFLAVCGLGMIWFGRHRYGAPPDEQGTGSVFKVEG